MPDSCTSSPGRRGSYCFRTLSIPSDARPAPAANGRRSSMPRRRRDGKAGRLRADRGGAGGALHAGRPAGEGPKALEYTTASVALSPVTRPLDDLGVRGCRGLPRAGPRTARPVCLPADTAPRVELLISRAERSSVRTRRRASTRRREPSRLRGGTGQRSSSDGRSRCRPTSVRRHVYLDQVATLLDEAQRVLGDDHRALRARLMALEAFSSRFSCTNSRAGTVGHLPIEQLRLVCAARRGRQQPTVAPLLVLFSSWSPPRR